MFGRWGGVVRRGGRVGRRVRDGRWVDVAVALLVAVTEACGAGVVLVAALDVGGVAAGAVEAGGVDSGVEGVALGVGVGVGLSSSTDGSGVGSRVGVSPGSFMSNLGCGIGFLPDPPTLSEIPTKLSLVGSRGQSVVQTPSFPTT